jgi:hypothetical protein
MDVFLKVPDGIIPKRETAGPSSDPAVFELEVWITFLEFMP